MYPSAIYPSAIYRLRSSTTERYLPFLHTLYGLTSSFGEDTAWIRDWWYVKGEPGPYHTIPFFTLDVPPPTIPP